MDKTVKYTKKGVTAEIEIKIKGERLSIVGTVYRGEKLLPSERNLISCGQCLDDAREIIPKRLYDIWERWHLNDMRAGTPAQEAAIRDWEKTNRYDYASASEYLKKIGLYEHDGYKYGTKWLTEPLPGDVIKYLESL